MSNHRNPRIEKKIVIDTRFEVSQRTGLYMILLNEYEAGKDPERNLLNPTSCTLVCLLIIQAVH